MNAIYVWCNQLVNLHREKDVLENLNGWEYVQLSSRRKIYLQDLCLPIWKTSLRAIFFCLNK